MAKLGLPLEQIVAEEEARWKAEKEAAEAERLRQEALERYRKRLQALHDKASVHCLAEAKELLMKGWVPSRGRGVCLGIAGVSRRYTKCFPRHHKATCL